MRGLAKEIKYDAFISYRHCQPDSDIAQRIQKKLEGFRIPKDVAKRIGKTRLNRVFRDETEFAVADDLTVAIETALNNSEFLIAICSRAYLESSWCQKEIESFLRFHDRKHILLVLADGEPDTAFPKVLLYEEVYSANPNGMIVATRKPIEPLAADCKGKDAKERNPKIDIAVIRLAASILGIGFDDLQQRHRKEAAKKARIRVLTAFGVLAAITAISLGFLIKIAGQNEKILKQNEEIAEQNAIIFRKYADTLAATSDNLLRDGKRKDAVYAARLALPDEKTDDYSELAANALINALGLYDTPDSFSSDGDIMLPCSVVRDMVISPEGRYAGVIGVDRNRYVVDLNSGETVFTFPDSDNSDFHFDGENGFLYVIPGENYRYYDLNSRTETYLNFSKGSVYSNNYGEGYAVITDQGAALYKGPEIFMTVDYSSLGFTFGPGAETEAIFIPGSDDVWLVVRDFERSSTSAFIVNMQSGSVTGMVLSNSSVLNGFATDGVTMIWSTEDGTGYKICLADAVTGEVISTRYETEVSGLAVWGNDVVVVTYDELLVMNRNLETMTSTEINGLASIMTTTEGIVLLGFADGDCWQIRNGGYSHFSPNNTGTIFICEKSFRNGKLYIAVTGENHIYTYAVRQSDYMTTYYGDYKELEYWSGDDPEKLRFRELVMKKEKDYTEDRIYNVVLCENADLGIIQLWDGRVSIYKASTGTHIKTIYTLEGTIRGFYYDQKLSYYYISASNIYIYEEDFRSVCEIPDCSLVGLDRETGYPVVVDLTHTDMESEEILYLVHPVTYEQLISMADDYLDGFEPDDRIKEKYSL